MSFSWEDFFLLAQKAVDETGVSHSLEPITTPDTQLHEARQRMAISRAYYAAFCSARAIVRRDAPSLLAGDGTDHFNVRDYFAMNAEPTYQAIGRNLGQLKILRGKADYEDVISQPDKQSVAALLLANRVLNDVGGL